MQAKKILLILTYGWRIFHVILNERSLNVIQKKIECYLIIISQRK